ncbi:uncharacterized protein LY89DRAFT_683536 [Mollisia scopiformis]|uniref:Ubiquitin 3 binding protein But2 C-terminal domain-containing protein n=1 Tax=Mollisia scopiformis TaxID=149040 RepID=A0A194XEI4_MOLSC|nr:uncharacterized protein LY89DRAFT_683536 [Mollisia scopiformis]KUJ18600.1 hypothetical protein LY89DRAFT_683536 [Mollisia scopiformis]
MRSSITTLGLLALFSLSSAAPTPIELAPRCGTTVFPTFLQQLTETSPSTVQANTLSTTGDFHVSQTVTNGVVSNRIYQVVAFENIPSTAYGCQLNVVFPASYPITSTGTPTLNVTTLYNGSPSSITYPNNWSWSTFYPPTSPPFGQGLFDTVTFAPGQSAAINSEVCGQNLAFVFEVASWVGVSSSVEFNEYVNLLNGAGLAGVYLTYGC